MPQAIASAVGTENVSARLERTNKSARCMNSATSRLLLARWKATASPSPRSSAKRRYHLLLSLSHDIELPVRTFGAQPGGGFEEIRYTLDRRELTYKYDSLCLRVASNIRRREKHAGVGNIGYDLEAPAQPIPFNRILQGATDWKDPIRAPECRPA